MSQDDDTTGHDSLNCPQCQAYSEICKTLGHFAESLEKMLEDGTFYRLGYELGKRREEAVLKAALNIGK